MERQTRLASSLGGFQGLTRLAVLKTANEAPLVQSVDRALQILLSFEAGGCEQQSINQISQNLGLPKSTVHRLLSALAQRGFIDQVSETGCYRLGLKVHSLGAHVVLARSLTSEGGPIMRRLLNLYGETVSLSMLDGIETVIVEKMESNLAMRVTSQIGKRNPLHCSAGGKVMLAFQTPETRARIIALLPLQRFTAKTITDADNLKVDLAAIRERGYAIDDEEIQDDQICISAPVWNFEGNVFAALTIPGPANRIRNKGIATIAASLVEGARELSLKLGGPERPKGF